MHDEIDTGIDIERSNGSVDDELADDELVLTSTNQDSPQRANKDVARRIIEGFYPDSGVRRQCLERLADSIVQLSGIGKGYWGVSLFPDRVALNAGRLYACALDSGSLVIAIDTQNLAEVVLEQVTPLALGKGTKKTYKSVPSSLVVHIPSPDIATVLPLLGDAHHRFLQRAAAPVYLPVQKAHSRGVIEYLHEELARDIPHPQYPTLPGSPFTVKDVISASLSSSGLHYTPWQISTFYTALQTKGFVILSGISGTGKSKLAQHFADLTNVSDDTGLQDPFDRDDPRSSFGISGPTPIGIETPNHASLQLPARRLTKPHLHLMEDLRRIAVPFHPPLPGEQQQVRIVFNGKVDLCSLKGRPHSHGQNVVTLELPRHVQAWFNEHANGNDQVSVEAVLTPNHRLIEVGIYPDDRRSGISRPETPNQRPILEVRGADAADPVAMADTSIFVSVRPDWRDSKSLLGYYNPLSQRYEWTPFLRFLLEATSSYDHRDGLAWFVILDEMNLARVEYYFADLLSVLESGRDSEGWTREPLRLGYPEEAEGDLPPRELRLPPNLYLVGTVNMDETTHAFSPKVLDRAFTLELSEVDFTDYPVSPSKDPMAILDNEHRTSLLADFTFAGRFARIDKGLIAQHAAAHPEIGRRLQTLNSLLQPFNLHFGYRVFDEIVAFLVAAERNGLFTELGGCTAALDAAVLMKVLPKFHGSRGKLERPLRAVLGWCIDPDMPAHTIIDQALHQVEDPDALLAALTPVASSASCPRTAERAGRMLWSLHTDGFAAFG